MWSHELSYFCNLKIRTASAIFGSKNAQSADCIGVELIQLRLEIVSQSLLNFLIR